MILYIDYIKYIIIIYIDNYEIYAEQVRLRKEMEEDIAQQKRHKLMQDATRLLRLPAPPRAQTRAAGVLKRTGADQTTMVGRKKARRDEAPKSPEVTIVAEAEHFVSPMMGESTNVAEDALVAIEEAHEIQSSKVQQYKMLIGLPFFELDVFFIAEI